MTIDRETVIRLANEVGFVGYGEDVGNFSIPVPAFYSRLERFATLVLEHGRKPLTEEQIEAIQTACTGPYTKSLSILDFVRAIEAAHGITNKESSDAE